MLSVLFVALVLLITAVLLTRHYYLCQIEKLELAHESKNNLDFRRGYEGGWDAALRYRDQKDSYDRCMKSKNQ
jgi:hypothetical protein